MDPRQRKGRGGGSATGGHKDRENLLIGRPSAEPEAPGGKTASGVETQRERARGAATHGPSYEELMAAIRGLQSDMELVREAVEPDRVREIVNEAFRARVQDSENALTEATERVDRQLARLSEAQNELDRRTELLVAKAKGITDSADALTTVMHDSRQMLAESIPLLRELVNDLGTKARNPEKALEKLEGQLNDANRLGVALQGNAQTLKELSDKNQERLDESTKQVVESSESVIKVYKEHKGTAYVLQVGLQDANAGIEKLLSRSFWRTIMAGVVAAVVVDWAFGSPVVRGLLRFLR